MLIERAARMIDPRILRRRLLAVIAGVAMLGWLELAAGQESPIEAESGILKGAPELMAPLPKSLPPMAGSEEPMPVDWAMVLELARASNLEVQIACERLREANINEQLARLEWIPSLKVGTSWYNSAGRRQLIEGDVIEASKSSLYAGALASAQLDLKKSVMSVLRAKQQVYQRSGELDRTTRAEIQKVSNAYIDLVAAQAGAAVTAEIGQLIGDLVERSRLLLEQGLLTEVNVLGKEQELLAQLQAASEARFNHQAASAQLVMLLNLEPGTRLAASWDHLAPVMLVDENLPEDELVLQAISQGPGMAEIDAVLQAIAEQQRKIRHVALIPTFIAQTGYGGFGGGQAGDIINFGDRFDANVGAYWDVMELVGTKQTRDLFQSKKCQAVLQHRLLERRLAAGVIVARTRSIEARKRIVDAEKRVDIAIRQYSQSKKRMDADVAPNREVIDLGSVEVLPAIGGLARARGDYLKAVIEYNKAQVELMYLLGVDTMASSVQPPCCEQTRYVNGKPVETIKSPVSPVTPTVPVVHDGPSADPVIPTTSRLEPAPLMPLETVAEPGTIPLMK